MEKCDFDRPFYSINNLSLFLYNDTRNVSLLIIKVLSINSISNA